MKTFVPLLALAASVSATFNKAPPFSFPGNTDNECTDKQKPGFNWDDLDFGDFFDYKDFNFRGWKCEDDGGRRSRVAPRTFGFGKVIGGVCSSDKRKSPSFGCGPKVDKFSLGHIVVKPEFDCDLEFHYDMPDGSTCKHRSFCRSKGTKVVNRQCGGAKNVTIVYPPQPDKPKPTCSIKVPTISFDCETASSTKPPKTKTRTSSVVTTTAPPAVTTTDAEEPVTTSDAEEPVTTSDAEETSSKVVPGDSTTVTPTPDVSTTVSDAPEETGSTESPEEVTSSKAPEEVTSKTPEEVTTKTPEEVTTKTADEITSSDAPEEVTSSDAPEEVTSSPAEPSSTGEPETTAPPVTKTITTSYDTTSTIFTTTTQTVTQCEPTEPECPAGSVTTTVVTIAVSTTICPVTETLTTVETNVPVTTPSAPATGVVTASSGVVSSAEPVETLPCPSVVPSCLNTFLFTTGCSDNSDAACYCPDATFVKNVYECLYAHGETDAIVAEAIAYFQGICGKWAEENPAIVTDATITSYITVTATPTVAPVYTTVTVDVTTVVPCTDDAGEVIPSSSTTVTVSTSMTVPQVDFTTGSTGAVDMIPITAAPVVTGSPTGSPTDGPDANPDAGPTTIGTITPLPTGTGFVRPTPSIVTAGSARVGASFGLAAVVALAAAVAL